MQIKNSNKVCFAQAETTCAELGGISSLHCCIGRLKGAMNALLYTRAQRAIAELKGAVYELIVENPEGLTNAEIGRRLGIYQGHVGHEGHISRTILAMLEAEDVAVQNKETKVWSLRKAEAVKQVAQT